MPGYTLPLTESRIIADLMKRQSGHSSAIVAGSTSIQAEHDRWALTGTPGTSYTLSFLPLDQAVWVFLNGLELDEGTDYTCDYTTGVITTSTTLTAGDVLRARYLTTGNLAVQQAPVSAPTAPEFWYKADSLSLADGASITSWPDSSSNANNATPSGTAPTFIASAVNGKPCLRWSTACDLTSGTAGRSTGSWTAFGVFRADTSLFPGGASTSASFFGGVDGSRQFRLGALNNPPNACHAQALEQNITNYGLDMTFTVSLDGTWHIIAVTVDHAAGSGYYWLDGFRGSALNSVAVGTTYNTTFTIGHGYSSAEAWRGDMAEIIGWGRVLTDAEMTAEFRSLGSKYGIATQ